jgi:hypothetical protein
MKSKKTIRGGKRKGAGRKKLGNVLFARRVHPQDVPKIVAFIKALPPRQSPT